MKCTKCGNEINEGAETCNHCGADLQEEVKRKRAEEYFNKAQKAFESSNFEECEREINEALNLAQNAEYVALKEKLIAKWVPQLKSAAEITYNSGDLEASLTYLQKLTQLLPNDSALKKQRDTLEVEIETKRKKKESRILISLLLAPLVIVICIFAINLSNKPADDSPADEWVDSTCLVEDSNCEDGPSPMSSSGSYYGHEYVDLGLPSGLMWATCNVGAEAPEDYGDYFAWGETSSKSTYAWNTYKWCRGTYKTMTKYCTSSDFGMVDNKTTLDLENDAAYVNWGGSWRMPTEAEQEELRNANNCTCTKLILNGVKGYKITSKKNGNSIFFPAAGYYNGSSLNNDFSDGYYWSSSLYTHGMDVACNTKFVPRHMGSNSNRCFGQSVRAVYSEIQQDSDFTAKDDNNQNYQNGHEYVDLGLSVKWATCNVGAEAPEDYGDYFAWGETRPKSIYVRGTYKGCNGSSDSRTNIDNNIATFDPMDDAAHVNWGGSWRMPTRGEMNELLYNCTWDWTTQNGVKGYKVTSYKNGNSIFLPAAGIFDNRGLRFVGSYGSFWSPSLFPSDRRCAYNMSFNSNQVKDWRADYRYNGHSVRPVCP